MDIDNTSPLVYGPNVWLIDEMYRTLQEDPQSVSETWREFLEDYVPVSLPLGAPATPAPVTPAPPDTRPTLPEGAMELRGPAEIVVRNMTQSLGVPTATSTRVIPVKLMEENRRLINKHLEDSYSGKVSFTHIIAWAIVKALQRVPAMTASFHEADGLPYKVVPGHVHLGIAVDVQRKDGSRSLIVPNIKHAEAMSFPRFFAAYNDLMRRVATNKITPDDFAGTTVSLTNPGMIGTVHSIPRLMPGQSAIIGTGSIDYPAEWQSADARMLARLGISKVMQVTSTYDHRVIQGAESGLFLDAVHKLLTGADRFYEELFAGLRIPYAPIRLTRDINPSTASASGDDMGEHQAYVLQLINMYRVRGHLQANLNPLSQDVHSHSELNPELYGLSLWDYDREFLTLGLAGKQRMTLREILDTLREAYCLTIGVEFMHIQEPDQKHWIQTRSEGVARGQWLTHDKKHRILDMLNAAEAFERFLHTKYIGHKRFGLEGAESLIPTLDALFSHAIDLDVETVVMGMAHRGRLNVLSNILGKGFGKIFGEFDGNLDPDSMQGSGDVKYHLGANGTYRRADDRTLYAILSSNPSHLEAVDPVVEGMTRAMQDRKGDTTRSTVLPLLIHGDAAFAGQGVVAETLNFSMLSGYRTGGTIHIVVNNGIGFTTSPRDARSSVYATDVAKMVQAPIFHVNGDDPEACVRVIELALEFRQEFRKDVVVDLICYRKHGHNEGDDPSYTQPIMYAQIRDKRPVRKLYTEALVNRGDITIDEAEKALLDFQTKLQRAFDETRSSTPPQPNRETVFREIPEHVTPDILTAVPRDTLDDILAALTGMPPSFTIHPKLGQLMQQRRAMLERNAVDWATAEALAFGSLLVEGFPIRLSGQDTRRGTFSQRHSVLVDHATAAEYIPLNAIRPGQATFLPYDSLLSEYAVLGFDYGFSVAWSDCLVIWEAQFGDFVNGAEIIIDQFIAAAEDKWKQRSGLVMLLPHGFEGQGPEHSSARMERFLTLCAEANMRVAAPTTAAQYFHLLRRQALLEEKKPLVVFTPKSLLRADAAKSAAEAFSENSFQCVIDDPAHPTDATRLLLCSGKVAHDLFAHRAAQAVAGTVIARVEQLYPFPLDEIVALIRRYPKVRDVRWVQEEPRNMGAWNFVYARLRDLLKHPYTFDFVGRVPSGSPASGSQAIHIMEQEKLLAEAFG
jgi:multifunctional 2-oxoglutarate metabolism enzyme